MSVSLYQKSLISEHDKDSSLTNLIAFILNIVLIIAFLKINMICFNNRILKSELYIFL